jgi:hypothetical protein
MFVPDIPSGDSRHLARLLCLFFAPVLVQFTASDLLFGIFPMKGFIIVATITIINTLKVQYGDICLKVIQQNTHYFIKIEM